MCVCLLVSWRWRNYSAGVGCEIFHRTGGISQRWRYHSASEKRNAKPPPSRQQNFWLSSSFSSSIFFKSTWRPFWRCALSLSNSSFGGTGTSPPQSLLRRNPNFVLTTVICRARTSLFFVPSHFRWVDKLSLRHKGISIQVQKKKKIN